MHELAIAEALIEQVQRELNRAAQRGRVHRVELSIGRLSGVNCASLRFAFDLLAPGTVVEGAALHINQTAAVCECRSCGKQTTIEELVVACPLCGSEEIGIQGGRDLFLQSIDIEGPCESSPPRKF